MIKVDAELTVTDECSEILGDKITCPFCMYSVSMIDIEDGESMLVCACEGPNGAIQLPDDYRCLNGRWLCKEEGKEEFTLLSFDDVLWQRVNNNTKIDVVRPWF